MILWFVLAEALLLVAGFALDQPLLGAALAGALVFLIVAYRYPAAAWLLVWLAAPFSVERRIPGGHALYLPVEPMMALALLVWGVRALESGSIRIPRSGLHRPLAALAAAALLSALFSPFALLGIKAWVAAAGYVAFGYLYWFLNPRAAADLKRWAPWVVGFSALWGLYGTVRVLAEGVSLRHAYGAARPFFTEHGAYGAYLAMTLPLALLLTVERRGRAQGFYAAASLAITLGILFSLTRAAWVSLALVLPLTAVLWALWRRRALKPVMVVAALGAVILVVLWGSGSGERLSRHAESITHSGDASNLERVNRWMAAAEMVRDRPVLGVGLAAYPGMYPFYRRKLVLTELAYQRMGPHSELFRLISEMGIAGFLAAAWFLSAAVVMGFRVFRRSADPRARLLSLALLSGLGTYVVHALFRTYLDLEKVAIPFWATLGMIAAMGREFQEAAPPGPHPDLARRSDAPMSPNSPRRAIRVLAVDHTAGIEPFRRKFAALAAHSGIDLTVLAPDRWVENYRTVRASGGHAENFEFRTGAVVWPGYENRAFFRSGLGPAIRHARPDVLHLWQEPFSLFTLQALIQATIWAPRAKALFFSSDNLSRGFRYPYRPSAFYARVERFAHRRCAGGTAVSSEVVEVLRGKGFSKPIEVIPLGVDLAEYPSRTESGSGEFGRRATPEEARARFGLEPPIVAFAGRLLHQKGVDTLLHAARTAGQSIAIVGEGPERARLERLAADLGIGERTRFFPMVPHAEVPALLAAVDVLVLPSRTTPRLKEQFGRVLIEGMAAGCVVIGSSSGAIPEVLGDAGVIFPEEDAEALGEALRRVARDPALAAALRVRGRVRVRERFTWEAIASRIVDFYERLLAPQGTER